MSNSPLVSYTRISPNKTSPRKHVVDTISIHCVAGNCSVETVGSIFAPSSRKASSNYAVGTDGRIGMYVEEKDRSWCTSSPSNDHRAITIEVANDGGASTGWHVSDKALSSLIKLLADICRRNNISQLLWQANKALVGQVDKQNMTVHRWFSNTACPGDYLYSKHQCIASEVNKLLGSGAAIENEKEESSTSSYPVLRKGDRGAFVKILQTKLVEHGLTLSTDGSFGALTEKAVKSFQQSKSLISDGVVGTLTWSELLKEVSAVTYTIKITTDALNVRKGPGTSYDVVLTLRNDTNKYTIIEESNGAGAKKWGRLKSGVGWISLDYTEKV